MAHWVAVFLLLSIVQSHEGGQNPATQSTVPDKDTGPLNYYANAHPYLEEPLERLRELIPELKELQPTPDQKELPIILQKTGQRVDDFTNNMVDLIARDSRAGGTKLEIRPSR